MALQSDREWQKFGERDPYWSVFVFDKFRSDVIDEHAKSVLYDSGREHIAYLLETASEMFPGFFPKRALDFGCGVGRCAIPLAAVCPEVVGVDVSDGLLVEAAKNAAIRDVHNARWIKSTDDLEHLTGRFDFLYSSFTIQHIRPKRFAPILQRLVARLAPDGVGALDFLIHREASKAVQWLGTLRARIPFFHGIVNLLERKPFSDPLMEKNVYDLNEVLRLLQREGCGGIQVRLFRNGTNTDAIVFFQKKADPQVPHERFVEAHSH